MFRDYRTLIPVCLALGLAYCAVHSSQALASAWSVESYEAADVRTKINSITKVEAANDPRNFKVHYSAKVSNLPQGARYVSSAANVSKAQYVRAGLLRLSAGVKHPAVLVAAAAASVLIADDGSLSSEVEVEPGSIEEKLGSMALVKGENYFKSSGIYFESVSDHVAWKTNRFPNSDFKNFEPQFNYLGNLVEVKYKFSSTNDGYYANNSISYTGPDLHKNDIPEFDPDEPLTQPIDIETATTLLEEFMPPEIVKEIYQDSVTDPQMQNDVLAVGAPEVSASGNISPELAKDAQSVAKNLYATGAGIDAPPEVVKANSSKTADEQVADTLGEAVPKFGSIDDPTWVIDEITDLPDYSISFGSASCPADLNFSLYGQPVEFSYETPCMVAGWLRPFIIGFCFLAALYIVVGVRQSA